MTRKSGDRRASRSQGATEPHQTVPELPGSTVAHEQLNSGVGTEPAVATYPVEGNTTVSGHNGASTTANAASDNVSTAAVKDGTVGDTSVDGLSKDLARSKIADNKTSGAFDASEYTNTSTVDRSKLNNRPFDRAAFHASFGDGSDSTTYEQTTKSAVVQEVIKPSTLEEVHPIFHREHHVIHHQTRIQPVVEQTLLPPKHYVVIDGQKHEITGEAIMNHVVTQRDYIPMNVKPKIIVHQYVDDVPLLGPITNVGASLINKDVVASHQKAINQQYEQRIVGNIDLPVDTVTRVNYMPGQVPVTTERGVGPASLATSGVALSQSPPTSPTRGSRLPVGDAIERSAQRLPDQRAAM